MPGPVFAWDSRYVHPCRQRPFNTLLREAHRLPRQFAYNEMSFFMVRLLQNFDSVSLDLTAQPAESLPPAEWKQAPGRKGQEEIFLKTHFILYSLVSVPGFSITCWTRG